MTKIDDFLYFDKKVPAAEKLRHQTHLLVFDCGLATQNAVEERGIKLRLSLIGVKAVLFLLHVGQLRVAKTEPFHCYQAMRL